VTNLPNRQTPKGATLASLAAAIVRQSQEMTRIGPLESHFELSTVWRLQDLDDGFRKRLEPSLTDGVLVDTSVMMKHSTPKAKVSNVRCKVAD
jgi:hypothetical protein